mmetsp:Transcript_4879/g.13612  ORF Transcript_4879/g.13612 Transcript_4879/m.13612 type:complete len:272 (-) Transcript_4879:575-1390(-)
MRCSPASAGSSRSTFRARFWSKAFILRYVPAVVSVIHWLTMIRLHGMLAARRACSNRLLSLMASWVGIVAITNSMASLSWNSACTIWILACRSSSFFRAALWLSGSPNSPLMAEEAWSSFRLSRMIFPRDESKKSGRLSSRRVCPVGAVSKIIRVNLAYSSFSTNSTTLAIATPSSSPGGAVLSTSPRLSSFSGPASMPRPMPDRKSSVFCCPSAVLAWLLNSSVAASTSTSIPHRSKSVPSICTGFPPPMSWSKESPRECAGSVETTRTE